MSQPPPLPKKVLVVDDDVDLAELISTALKGAGYQTIVACDGHEALMAIDKERFDLALIDVMMPRIDGLTLVKALKGHQQTKATPLIIVTAKTDTRTFAAGITAGAAALIHKPFRISELLEKVAKYIS